MVVGHVMGNEGSLQHHFLQHWSAFLLSHGSGFAFSPAVMYFTSVVFFFFSYSYNTVFFVNTRKRVSKHQSAGAELKGLGVNESENSRVWHWKDIKTMSAPAASSPPCHLPCRRVSDAALWNSEAFISAVSSAASHLLRLRNHRARYKSHRNIPTSLQIPL